ASFISSVSKASHDLACCLRATSSVRSKYSSAFALSGSGDISAISPREAIVAGQRSRLERGRQAKTVERLPDVMHLHSAFDRYRESCPRRSELHQNCYSRDGDEQSAVPAG